MGRGEGRREEGRRRGERTHVVHFPPAIVRSPLLETLIIWFRTRDSVFFAPGSLTRGLKPDHADRTCTPSASFPQRETKRHAHLPSES